MITIARLEQVCLALVSPPRTDYGCISICSNDMQINHEDEVLVCCRGEPFQHLRYCIVSFSWDSFLTRCLFTSLKNHLCVNSRLCLI